MLFERVKENIVNIDPRERFQEANLRSLVKYAKSLTVDLEEQKTKVVMSEQIIDDLKKAGSDDMGSLIDMLHSYKEKVANNRDEIDKLNQLSVIKDEEIVKLDVILDSLNDFLSNMAENQDKKIAAYSQDISSNAKLIRRQDKLIVDLQQKNELSQNAVAVTQEKTAAKTN